MMAACEVFVLYGIVTTVLFVSVAVHGSHYNALDTALRILLWPLYLFVIVGHSAWGIIKRLG